MTPPGDEGTGARPEPDSQHRGQGAVLGVRVLRNSGIQGMAMAGAAALHLVTLFVVAHFLGAAQLGRFAVLYFGANLLAQLLSVAVKPGTIRRTFGEGDDEGDDDEEEDDVGASPQRSLGTGLVLAATLAAVGTAAAIIFRAPLADLLLGSREDADLVFWTALLGGATVLSRLTSIVIWFERRPGAFLLCELSRPVLSLLMVTILLAAGAGLEAVLIGGAAGTMIAAIVGFVALRRSFDPVIDRGEVWPIFHRGLLRGPIMMSFWTIASADVFILSRFVSDADLGTYTLASRVGFIAAFLPQGFRVALRPLRKASIYKAVEEQYGRAEHRGQLLGYFFLLCISAILGMVLIGPLVVDLAPSGFADAAPLIPLAAAGMVGPALLRTVNQQTTWPGRTRNTFVASTVLAALGFIGLTILLAPEIGSYAAPVGMIGAMSPPAIYLFVRSQRGPDRIGFPYRGVGTALGLAVLIGTVYALLPDLPFAAEAAVAAVFGAAYLTLLPLLRAIPEAHWEALTHMRRSVVSGRPDQFKPRRGLRALDQSERDSLRTAVASSWASRERGEEAAGDGIAPAPARPGMLVALLRRAGERGGVPVGQPTELDGGIGEYLFSAEPTAVRNAAMRALLAAGAEAKDLRTLEDLVGHLARIPKGAWERRTAPEHTQAGA